MGVEVGRGRTMGMGWEDDELIMANGCLLSYSINTDKQVCRHGCK